MEKQYEVVETETKKTIFGTKAVKTTVFIGTKEKAHEVKARKEKIAKKYNYNCTYAIWPY